MSVVVGCTEKRVLSRKFNTKSRFLSLHFDLFYPMDKTCLTLREVKPTVYVFSIIIIKKRNGLLPLCGHNKLC